ncbi:Proline racemase [Fusarium oxysporum f. sp. cubense race 1]|uniref:trans-L-3-hydroxyproline dehydratase n=1 Tax=Fusarium oxysporum f. sp. cubense (strain race 1) TaxID=1229664 RepID=N4UML4_FUSC1|nr:Proline racemase [Fusarium oxysporum f. sp. cubense race 1]
MADKSSYWVESEDWHTAGEPFRIIQHLPSGFLPEVQTVSERRIEIVKTKDHPLDRLRIFLSHEPRGHADMYGGFIVDVVIDVPSGRVVASVTRKDGKSIYADFVNVSTYQIAKGLSVAIPSRDSDISVDLTFAGAVIASVDTTQLGLEVKPSNANEFIRIQREFKASLGDRAKYGPNELYAMLFFEEEENGKGLGWIVQKSINVYGDGQIDRSPCGSGTCGRMAILLAEGRLRENSKLLHHSIIGSAFEAEIVSKGQSPVEGFPACVVRVRGQAYLVAETRFFINAEDPVSPGFVLR